MNFFIILIVFVLSASAQLPRTYLPQTEGQRAQEGYQSNQNFQSSTHISGDGPVGNRTQASEQQTDKDAAVLKQDQDIGEDGSYHFGFETSNGIRAEEAKIGENVQGGFAYKGEDGITYTITYTSGEGGFRPQGEHLPVPPPTPEAILEALKKNELDEAAGIFDDGQYHPDQTSSGPEKVASGSQFEYSNDQESFNSNSGYKY